MIAVIVLWNTVYLSRAVRALQERGQVIDEALLQHLSPLGWEHINLTGDYSWQPSAGLQRALGRREPEHDDWTDELVLLLLRSQQAELERIPFIGRRYPDPIGGWQDITRGLGLRAERSERACKAHLEPCTGHLAR